jgi:Spy/CpxP family protein refolding chaperone
MTIRNVRKSVLTAAGIVALGIAGLFAGRLSADAFPHGGMRDGFAPRMFYRMSKALDMTDDQQSQVKGVLRAHQAEIEAQLTASRTARQALHAAVVAQPFDEAAIRAKAADVAKAQADGAVLFAKIRSEIDPILTPDQKTKILTFQSKMRQRGDNAVQSFRKFLNSDGSGSGKTGS